ncbi:MAG: DUF349 domain-containing protein [Bacteroidales bacterium]|nr:DUF349 domain-containing protein [Bacteroidales bacterium]
METQDPISTQNQEQAPDNANVNTPEATQKNDAPKMSAAELLLQRLQARKQEESITQIIDEVQKESEVSPTSSEDNTEAAEEEQPKAEAETSEPAQTEAEDSNADAEIQDTQNVEEESDDSTDDLDAINYAELSKEGLLDALEKIVSRNDVHKCKTYVDYIKTLFYKQISADVDQAREKFIENGFDPKDFRATPDPLEDKFKALFDQYRDKRNKYNEQLEQEKLNNLKLKEEIVAKIENLINSQENINQTFEEFKNLQKQWREIGIVPQTEVKKLWGSYNYQVERFYEIVKINRELRDLDLKKNTEQKIQLCERAEELLLEPKVVKAFNELQKLHEQWREIGPVVTAQKEEIWERFKKATSTINKKHQDYYANLKKEQENNFRAKTVLCEKAEEIIEQDYHSRSEWDEKNKEILSLQQFWKMIGFAPKKHNNAVYERFRSACDKFFEKKREYYAQNKEEEENNLQLKEDLCVQAEGLKDSTDWRKTTDILKRLQAKWKTIGPVPRKHSEEVWQRFRAACNTFFDNKKQHFDNIDKEQEENLKLKEQLITEVENFQPADSDEKNIAALKELQKRWSEIGLVPISKKDSLYDRFRKAIDAQFAKINIDEAKRNEIKIKHLIEAAEANPQALDKLRNERDRLKSRLDGLRQQIALSENNLGFFAKSKSADAMIESFRRKMEKSKSEADALQKMINNIGNAINDVLSKRGDKKN